MKARRWLPHPLLSLCLTFVWLLLVNDFGLGHWLLGDIVVANLQVAKLILGPVGRLRPAFVEIPLQLNDELALTMLASIISLTPGTVSADLSDDKRMLLVHSLDVDDEEELVRSIQTRYEAPLLEVFACSPT